MISVHAALIYTMVLASAAVPSVSCTLRPVLRDRLDPRRFAEQRSHTVGARPIEVELPDLGRYRVEIGGGSAELEVDRDNQLFELGMDGAARFTLAT